MTLPVVESNSLCKVLSVSVGLGGLGVPYSPRDPSSSLNPAEVDEFLSGRKNPEHKTSGRDFKGGPESEISGSLKNLKPEKL